MYLVKRRLKDFSAAHRLVKGYTGKCQSLHGHNYLVTITVSAKQLDSQDFVVEFSQLKALCDNWVQAQLDHAVLVCEEDRQLLEMVKREDEKHYVLPENRNTTAEAIAEHLFDVFKKLIINKWQNKVLLIEVDVAETPNSHAAYRESL